MAFLGVLPEAPSFGTQLARGLGSGLGSGFSHGIQSAVDFARQMKLEEKKAHSLVSQTKQLEKVKLMETGLGTINRMRDLVPSAGPSNAIQGFFGGKTTKDRAELEQLGRSLIPLVATGVSIRNQKEFDEYKKIITNPNSLQAELQGALDGLQNILERGIGQSEEERPSGKLQEAQLAKGSKREEKVKMTKNGKTKLVPKSSVKLEMEHGAVVVK